MQIANYGLKDIYNSLKEMDPNGCLALWANIHSALNLRFPLKDIFISVFLLFQKGIIKYYQNKRRGPRGT